VQGRGFGLGWMFRLSRRHALPRELARVDLPDDHAEAGVKGGLSRESTKSASLLFHTPGGGIHLQTSALNAAPASGASAISTCKKGASDTSASGGWLLATAPLQGDPTPTVLPNRGVKGASEDSFRTPDLCPARRASRCIFFKLTWLLMLINPRTAPPPEAYPISNWLGLLVFGVWDLVLGVWCLGFGVWGLTYPPHDHLREAR